MKMAYVSPNFPTKKALKEAVAARQIVTVFSPGIGSVPLTGEVDVEGPHYPKPHTWYAEVMVVSGIVTKVR
jgi:hypothetical protein